MTYKEREARDIAASIAESDDTDVDPDDLDDWQAYDIYEWIEAWGWVWDDKEGWMSPQDEVTPDAS